ncbi:MAG: hypothetical protein O2U61_06010 [Candidatus Bathyarchaeota archaeon]|nr:hypothetical protein [Candidatus Bathyarchaeota archaeon]
MSFNFAITSGFKVYLDEEYTGQVTPTVLPNVGVGIHHMKQK